MNQTAFIQLPPGPPRPPQGASVPHGNSHPPPPPPPPKAPVPALPHRIMQRPTAPVVTPVMIPQPMPQPMPIPPPNEVIPLELRHKRLVERSDLRSERMTDADAREALSEYAVYRFEKVNDANEIDDEGYPVKPTWENVTRTEVRDLSKPTITRNIRQLNEEGKSVMQKKLDLTAAQQRQIEKAQNDLETHNPDKRFYYTLQQIDSKTRKLNQDSIEYRQYMAGRESKKVTVSKTKKSKKNLLETIALTVYFKREPRDGENATAILKERKRDAEHKRKLEDQQRQNQQAQQLLAEQHRYNMMRQQQANLERRMIQPPMPRPSQYQPQNRHQLPPAPNAKQLAGSKGPKIHVIENDPRRGHKPKVYTVSSQGSRSSRSSYTDDSFSDSEFTPESSVTGSSDSGRHGRRRRRSRGRSRGRSHGRNRSRSHSRGHRRYHDRPEDYGVPTRHHTKNGQHYILDIDTPRGGLMPVPPPLAPSPMPGAVDRLEYETLQPRRIAERAHDHELDDLELFNDLGLRRQSTLPPRVINRRPSFRVIDSEEVVRQRHEDDLNAVRRLQIRDEMRLEREEELAAGKRDFDGLTRRHLETRFRRPSLDRGALFREGPEETFDEMEARKYMRQQERGARTLPENPFEPLGRAGRKEAFARVRYY
ncbi:hypothetical protein LZ31DRAFT_3589 [Colletotrichum somersetense]|nr:hypothetical protein LZ31DRAFT_3589 [Colletotrichum somersetense]